MVDPKCQGPEQGALAVQPRQGVDGWRKAKLDMQRLLERIMTKNEEVNSATVVCNEFSQTEKSKEKRAKTNDKYHRYKHVKKFMASSTVMSVAKVGSELL